jgi:hypothetical protein
MMASILVRKENPMVRSTVLLFPCLLATLSITGCGAHQEDTADEPHWQAVKLDEMTPAQQKQLEKALAAKSALFTSLSGRLAQALSEGDPADAIAVCAKAAPQIAKDVSSEHGLSIGRTSFRLRNPDNTPPEWAEDYVANKTDKPVYLAREGKLATLLAIRIQPLCLTCHGPKIDIDPEVQEALVREYPRDEAIGFRQGDLRGWFWVEVPAADGAQK